MKRSFFLSLLVLVALLFSCSKDDPEVVRAISELEAAVKNYEKAVGDGDLFTALTGLLAIGEPIEKLEILESKMTEHQKKQVADILLRVSIFSDDETNVSFDDSSLEFSDLDFTGFDFTDEDVSFNFAE